MLFSKLPLDLLRHCLKFLTLSSIQSLDCAILSHEIRTFYLSALQGFDITNLPEVACKANLIQWLWKRQVLIHTLKVSEYQPFSMKSLISQNSSTICHMNFLPGSSVDDEIMIALGQCHNLVTLCVELSNITHAGLQSLLSGDRAVNKLQSLNISSCQLSGDSMLLISQSCPNLMDLALSGNFWLDDDELDKIIEGCPKILFLDVSKSSISDISVRKVLEKYPNLQSLTLYNATEVSPAAKSAALQRIASPQVQSDIRETQLLGTRAIRKALSDEHEPPIQEVVSLGVIPRLIQFLSVHENPVLQFEAAWALTNIASGSTNHTLAVVEAGAIPPLVDLLQSPYTDVLEQAAWALGNIAGDNVACRDMLLSAGALIGLSSIEVEKESVMRNVTWAISNLCRGKPAPPLETIRVALPFLLRRVMGSDDESRVDACWAMSYLTDGENSRIQEVLEMGFLEPIVQIFATNENRVLQTATLRIIGNILSGDEHHTQAVLNLQVLFIFQNLLSQPGNSNFKKEVCWSVSNITAGTSEQLQQVLDSEILVTIIQLGTKASSDLQKECVYCVSNGTHVANEQQMDILLEIGSLNFLQQVAKKAPERYLAAVLEGILNILRKKPDTVGQIDLGIINKLRSLAKRSSDLGKISNEILSILPADLQGGKYRPEFVDDEWEDDDGDDDDEDGDEMEDF